MWKKIRPRQREAFLKALAETGNVTLAAEHARLSRSWVVKWRRLDPAFDAACRAAVSQAQEGLRNAEEARPGKKWRYLDGAELVVRGTNGRRVQIARARLHQWTPRIEDRYLATFQATCNATASAAAAGMTPGSAYAHRKRWSGFERRCREAAEFGTLQLEFALVSHCANLFSPRELPEPAPMPPMTPDQMLHNLHMHKHEVSGIGRRPGGWGRRPDMEAVTAKVIRNADIVKRARSLTKREKKQAGRLP